MLKPMLPNLVVAERVIQLIAEESSSHGPDETGQALVGIRPTPWTLIVLGTVPDILDTKRTPVFFEQGGDDQVEIFRWFNKHWEAMRSKVDPNFEWKANDPIPKGTIPPALNFPLQVIGDWHRHPGLYKILSPHDRSTIFSILMDKAQKKEGYLTPIAVLDTNNKLNWKVVDGELQMSRTRNQVLVNWWYTSKQNPLNVYRLKPIILPNDRLPYLPPISWHLIDPARMSREIKLLEEAGCRVNWMVKEVNGDIHIREIVFGVDHPEWKSRLLLITQWDYPKSEATYQIIDKPEVRHSEPPNQANAKSIMPEWLQRIVASTSKASLWQQNAPMRLFRLSSEHYLMDLVRKIEPQLRGE